MQNKSAMISERIQENKYILKDGHYINIIFTIRSFKNVIGLTLFEQVIERKIVTNLPKRVETVVKYMFLRISKGYSPSLPKSLLPYMVK